LKAIIISGSEESACDHSKVSWMMNLSKFIVKIYTVYPNIKILGFGFGS